MSLNLLVSIIIYALMAFFVGCGFYHIVNLSKYQKDFAIHRTKLKKSMPFPIRPLKK